MRIASFLISSAMFSALSIAVFAGEAHAQDNAPGGAPPAVAQAPAPREQPTVEDSDDDYKHFTVGLNPLGVAIGRYSLQGEYLPAKHHAITLNPFFAHAPVTVTVNGQDVDAGSLNGFGGELGYRFYTGSKGSNGFFVGPSFIFASYSQSAPSGTNASSSSDSFTSMGGALDIGGQAIIGPGIVVGGGFGLQYTSTSKDIDTNNLNLASAVIAGGGVRPRFLMTVAYAF